MTPFEMQGGAGWRTALRRPAGEAHLQGLLAADGDAGAVGPHAHRVTSEAEPEGERLPGVRQARIELEDDVAGTQAEEAVSERLPDPAVL